MLVSMKKYFAEKGQGLTEYVLILAFVAGVAWLMFGNGSSLRTTVSSTFSASQSMISGAASGSLGTTSSGT